MRSISKSLAVLSALVFAGTAIAQQPKPKELDDVEIQSKHSFAGTVVYRFDNGILEYTFIEGRRKGAGGFDLDYTARKIGEDMYLVSWHDEMYLNHFAVVFDLKNKLEYTNAIMGYGKDSEQVFWTDSVIEKVTPIE